MSADLTTRPLALLGFASLCRAAVNENLSPDNHMGDKTDFFSCCAVSLAGKARNVRKAYDCAAAVLVAQGVNDFSPFSDIPPGPERQYARALWLTMLATAIEAGDMDPKDFGL